MIKLDPSLFSVEIVSLKSVTTAIGGSISIVDDIKTTTSKEIYKRIPVPMALCRAFIKTTKGITKYLKPVLTAIVKYDGRITALERHPLAGLGQLVDEGVFGPKVWVPDCQTNLADVVMPLTLRGDNEWFFDGRYMYSLNSQDVGGAVYGGEVLTADGQFRKIVATCLDLQELSNKNKLQPIERSCVAFMTNTGEFSVSPPIWKNISDIGNTQLKRSASNDILDDDDDDSVTIVDNDFSFDKIDERLSVNLNFALKAGNEIGRTFGYEFVEPLQLPALMVQLCTVNLPNIPKQIKATYPIGMSFTHALAWVLGLASKANNLETYLVIRSLLKYLTTKGIFRDDVFHFGSVFKDQKSIGDISVKKLEDLIDAQTPASISLI